jgi:anti-sigma regulatory factor (Ser/Thr protein kinase)
MPNPPHPNIKFAVIGADRHMVDAVIQHICTYARQYIDTPATIGHVELVLSEIFTNILTHGVTEGQEIAIYVEWWCDGAGFQARIWDDGEMFDYVAPDGPVKRISKNSIPENGWGLKIIHHLTRSFEITREDALNKTSVIIDT